MQHGRVCVACLQWSSSKPPKPDPDSPSDLQRRGASNGVMSGHQSSLSHPPHHHHSQQQAATSSSSRLGVAGVAGPGDSVVPGYQQQLAGVDGVQYPRAMCAAYNGDATPTAAHQGPTSLPTVGGYSPAGFSGSRGNCASATPGHAALSGPTAAAASYCMPMGQSVLARFLMITRSSAVADRPRDCATLRVTEYFAESLKAT